MIKVSENELEFNIDQIAYYKGKPYTGVGYSGKKLALYTETTYRNGRQHGVENAWDKGKLVSESFYYKGMLHGVHREYFHFGKVKKKQIEYELGMEIGYVEFNIQGEIIKSRKIDPSSNYYQLLLEKRKLNSST